MVAIRLKGTLTADRQLVVKIPDEIPAGEVDLIIEASPISDESTDARSIVRAKLAAAGALSTAWKVSPDMPIVDDDEMFELSPGSPTMHELIDQDRGER